MHKADCPDSFKKKIIEKYFDTVYRLAMARCKNPSLADDILQDVFLRYIKCDKAFESEEHIKAWLIRVTINCSKSAFTSSWFQKTVPLSEELEFESPELLDVYSSVMQLPLKYRTIIHLFYYEDMSVKQIALDLNMKESTVKSHLHRGREILKNLLGGRQDYEF